MTWEPAGAVTGIGSLPFTDPAEAVDFVAAATPEVPFWPQLPGRDPAEGMITQSLSLGWRGLRRRDGTVSLFVDEADLPDFKAALRAAHPDLGDHEAAGFGAFRRAARAGAFPTATVVKGQLTGPMTLAWFVICADEPVIARPSVVEALADRVVHQATWQVRALRTLGLPVLIFLDEPALAVLTQLGTGAWAAGVLREVCAAIRLAGAMVGIHCCTVPVDFRLLRDARPDVISFDAWRATVTTDAQAWWNDGGLTAFGLAPTGPEAPQPGDLVQRWLATASLGDDPVSVARHSLVTPTCGLGLTRPDHTERVFALAADTGRLLGEIAGHTDRHALERHTISGP